jgi:HNH endonuclease
MVKKGKAKRKPRERDKLPLKTRVLVLTECGYRCAVPTCRNILALDMHHIWEVSAGGGDDPSNLIALCPTDHALYHRGNINAESIYIYKAMLVAITQRSTLKRLIDFFFWNPARKISWLFPVTDYCTSQG